MKPLSISRRTMLRGMGGVSLALPALEIMGPSRAAADTDKPKRFVICHCGASVGSCYVDNEYGPADQVTPKKTGPNYEETLGLKSIFKEGVQSNMGIVSGLFIPVGPYVSPGTPPANWPAGGASGFHGGTHAPVYAGKTMYTHELRDNAQNACGASCDQMLVPIISSPTQYMPTLPLAIEYQGRWDGTTAGLDEAGYLSWQAPDPNGPPAPYGRDPYGRPLGRGILPIIQPSLAYKALFGSSAPSTPGTPGGATSFEVQKRYDLSVLDAVGKKTERLLKRLGQHDRMQMERWRDHLRTLEGQIGSTQLPKGMPPSPSDYVQEKDPQTYDVAPGWGNETARGNMQADLIYAAFMSDRTRVVSWLMSGYQTNLNMEYISGNAIDMHGMTHVRNGFPNVEAKAFDWHVSFVARLVKNLSKTMDFDGSPMIDNTVILMFWEGGWGRRVDEIWDSEAAREYYRWANTPAAYARGEGRQEYAHSFENMVMIMAGGKNFGLQPGQHIRYPWDPTQTGPTYNPRNFTNIHPGQVVWTAMAQMGFQGRYNSVPGNVLPEMLRLG